MDEGSKWEIGDCCGGGASRVRPERKTSLRYRSRSPNIEFLRSPDCLGATARILLKEEWDHALKWYLMWHGITQTIPCRPR